MPRTRTKRRRVLDDGSDSDESDVSERTTSNFKRLCAAGDPNGPHTAGQAGDSNEALPPAHPSDEGAKSPTRKLRNTASLLAARAQKRQQEEALRAATQSNDVDRPTTPQLRTVSPALSEFDEAGLSTAPQVDAPRQASQAPSSSADTTDHAIDQLLATIPKPLVDRDVDASSLSCIDEVMEDLEEALSHDPEKDRPKDYERWSASSKLAHLLDLVFRKPQTQVKHARLTVEQPLPDVDALFVPTLDPLLSSVRTAKKQADKLPLERDLRNGLRNFLDCAGPIAKLVEEAGQSTTGYVDAERVSALAVKALVLLGHATAYFNQQRRVAILNTVDTFKPLASFIDPKTPPTSGRHLFGPDLRSAIRERKELSQDLKEVLELETVLQNGGKKPHFKKPFAPRPVHQPRRADRTNAPGRAPDDRPHDYRAAPYAGPSGYQTKRFGEQPKNEPRPAGTKIKQPWKANAASEPKRRFGLPGRHDK